MLQRAGMREKAFRAVSLVVSVAIAVGIALGIVAGAMELADHMGWIVHPREATVRAVKDWPAGEEKSCTVLGDLRAPELVCDQGAEERKVRVEFRGSLHAKAWECAPGGEQVECKAK
ncbi:MAG TPA: hypothetical protein VMU43_12525 [Candidatus Acidoferrum sp.]|nr:hypothetical protein [Candidatus Acidoferrum sp.]